MIEQVRNYPKAAIVAIIIYYSVGVIGLSLDSTFNLFRALVPFTLLCSLYFLWLFQEGLNARFYIAALVILILGFGVEVAGVNTGWIFGNYSYGRTLGIKLWDTPLLIGVNWLLLIISCRALTEQFISARWLKMPVASFLMVIYDIALEPVAIRLEMWDWEGGTIPVQNYIAWFVVSFVFLIFLDYSVKQTRNKIAPALFIAQILFFTILNIIYRII